MHTTAEAQAVGPTLIQTKIRPPTVRTDLVARPELEALLDRATERRLTIVSAPTGYGKTTLISRWARNSGVRVAWLTVEAAENDPVRLIHYVVAALERAGVSIPARAQRSTAAPGVDLVGAVIPLVLNEVAAYAERVVLVIDDYHVLREARCHELVTSLIRAAPDNLRTIIATRSDPPLPAGRWRATGELADLRQETLRFDRDEADRFLNGLLGLGLDPDSVDTLQERTEGWAAGLYLAALSLESHADRAAFVKDFAGSSRHLIDYLAPEVLGPLEPEDRRFLLETSILERLTGSLCDAVTRQPGSDKRLRRLYHGNLFLTALDDEGAWYRHHRLFAELLGALLASETPELIPELHGRAADWYADQGVLEFTVRHALGAGRREQAGLAIARNWRTLTSEGQFETVQALLDELGPGRGALTAPLAAVEAMNAGARGAPLSLIDSWLKVAEQAPWDGPTPDGLEDISIPIAFARAGVIGDDLGASLAAGRRLVGRQPDVPFVDGFGRASVGLCLVLYGDPQGALAVLDGLGEFQEAPIIGLYGRAAWSLALTSSGDPAGGETAAVAADLRALDSGLSYSVVGGLVALARGTAVARQGRLAESRPLLEQALRYWGGSEGTLPRAYALLALAPVIAAEGDPELARSLAREARTILAASRDAGQLPAMLEQVERGLNVRQKRTLAKGDMPTEAEVRVLRLLAGASSQRAIAAELYLSVNTVKTHVKAINQRLGTSSRAEAVARARELGLI